MKESRLHIYSVPEGVNQYQDAFLFVGETQIDLMAFKVNLSQSWDGLAPNRVDNGVAIVRLEGKASLSLMLLSYQYAFRDNKPALAAAVGVILALIIISLTVLYLFIVRKQDKEANV